MSIARCRTVVGSLYALMRNALGLNVATSLESQELSCTVAPDRRLVVLGHEPIAGFARDHGTVADEAAMLALHTLDSTTLLTEPTFVAPGDSCTRVDDPGWRWHCLRGHGTQLADWERRPLAEALAGKADVDHTHAISAITGLQTALDGKQASLSNAAALARITADAGGDPKWDKGDWPGGGGASHNRRLQLANTGFLTWPNNSGFWSGSGGAYTIVVKVLAVPTPTSNWPTIARIGGFDESGNAIIFRVRRDLSTVCFEFYCAVDGTLYNCRTTTAFAFDYQYHTIIGTSDGTSTGLKIYIDGVVQAVTISDDGATTPGAPKLYVGGDATGDAGWLGFIDELAIAVGREWSATEVAAYQTKRAFPADPTWQLDLSDWPHAKVGGAAGAPTGFGSGLMIV